MIYISYLNVIYRLFPTSTTAFIFLGQKISRFKSLLNVKQVCILAFTVLSCCCFHPSTLPLTYWFWPASAATQGGHVDTFTSLPLAHCVSSPLGARGRGRGQLRLRPSRSHQPRGGQAAGKLASDSSPGRVRTESPAQREGLLGVCPAATGRQELTVRLDMIDHDNFFF